MGPPPYPVPLAMRQRKLCRPRDSSPSSLISSFPPAGEKRVTKIAPQPAGTLIAHCATSPAPSQEQSPFPGRFTWTLAVLQRSDPLVLGSRSNHDIHTAATCQIRQRRSKGRAYFERKVGEDKTNKEALRALKQHISNTVHRHLVADPAG